MEKQTVYYVQNDQTREYLARNNGWVRRRPSLAILRFTSEADAQAAIPPGVACSVIRGIIEVPEVSS